MLTRFFYKDIECFSILGLYYFESPCFKEAFHLEGILWVFSY